MSRPTPWARSETLYRRSTLSSDCKADSLHAYPQDRWRNGETEEKAFGQSIARTPLVRRERLECHPSKIHGTQPPDSSLVPTAESSLSSSKAFRCPADTGNRQTTAGIPEGREGPSLQENPIIRAKSFENRLTSNSQSSRTSSSTPLTSSGPPLASGRYLTQEEYEDRAISNSNAAARAIRSQPSGLPRTPPPSTIVTVKPDPKIPLLVVRPGPHSKGDLMGWLSDRDPAPHFDRLPSSSSRAPSSSSLPPPPSSLPPRPPVRVRRSSGRRDARYQPPQSVYPPPPPPRALHLGGLSKREQLGSVAASWGPPQNEAPVYGMFEIEADPPSRNTSPFKEMVQTEEEVEEIVDKARVMALGRARAGTVYETEKSVLEITHTEIPSPNLMDLASISRRPPQTLDLMVHETPLVVGVASQAIPRPVRRRRRPESPVSPSPAPFLEQSPPSRTRNESPTSTIRRTPTAWISSPQSKNIVQGHRRELQMLISKKKEEFGL